jgi:hypothetical protein
VSDTVNSKVFAFVVGEDVIGTIHIPETAPNYDRLVAGLSSDPVVIEATDVEGVQHGWKFDGDSFSNPKE